MILGLRHVGIVVADLNSAVHFYELLGFSFSRRREEHGDYLDTVLGLKGARLTTVKMASPTGGMIELVKCYSHNSVSPGGRPLLDLGISHIALTVGNLAEEYQRLTRGGIPFKSAPALSPDGLAKVAFCSDPEGNWIELVEEITYPKAA